MADYIQIDESASGSATKIAADEVSRGGTNVKRQAIGLDPSLESDGALSNASSTAYESSRVIKASPGRLFLVNAYSSLGSAQWIQLHNTTSVPANGAVPVLIYKVATIASITIDLGVYGRYFSTGITICNSTTGPTKTLGASDTWFDVQYL